jgi:glutamate racemase
LNPPRRPRPSSRASLPIGLFDSGVGGLTVFSALRRRLPGEDLLYLGDTARLPYGTKGEETIVRYALQATEKLVERRIKLLVVACNTATAVALPALQAAYAGLPVIGVVEPGARAACEASVSGRILVLGTESTIRGQAYTRAIQALRPQARVTGIACSLFVSLAEEGWMDGPVMEAAAARYLAPILDLPAAARPDCLVLACTHFPPLAPAIRSVLSFPLAVVDSAETTAKAVQARLAAQDLFNPSPRSLFHFMTTDAPERFARVAGYFLSDPRLPEPPELVAL